jgi:hypothetical protein
MLEKTIFGSGANHPSRLTRRRHGCVNDPSRSRSGDCVQQALRPCAALLARFCNYVLLPRANDFLPKIPLSISSRWVG